MLLITCLTISSQFFCQAQFPGGHLASITSDHIHRKLMSMMLSLNGAYTRTWIGGLRYLEVCMMSSRECKAINVLLQTTK